MKTFHIALALTLTGAAFFACSGGPSGTAVYVVPGWAPTPDGGVIPPSTIAGGGTGSGTTGSGSGTATGSSGGSGSGTAAGSGSGTTGSGSGTTSSSQCLPADVASMLSAGCTVCHGDPPLASALSGLVTLADLQATSKLDATKNEAEESVVLMTETSGATAMPPGTGSSAANIAILQGWITAGYPTVACTTSAGSGSGSTAGSGSGSTTGSGSGGTPNTAGVPCDVETMLANNCTACHGDPPLATALSGLVTLADLQATSKLDSTKNEAQESVALMTLTSGTTAMPPGTGSSAANIAILQNWINGGYAAGTACGTGDAGPPPTPNLGVFAGAPAYVAPANPGSGKHNAGKNCLQCHGGGGGDANQFTIGGTIYDASGAAVVGAEVRLVDANNKATSVYSGTNGNFYIQGSGFVGPAKIGIRNATTIQNMITPLLSGSQPAASNGGACNACHCTGGTCTIAPIHLP